LENGLGGGLPIRAKAVLTIEDLGNIHAKYGGCVARKNPE
jgi:hypothetical protein